MGAFPIFDTFLLPCYIVGLLDLNHPKSEQRPANLNQNFISLPLLFSKSLHSTVKIQKIYRTTYRSDRFLLTILYFSTLIVLDSVIKTPLAAIWLSSSTDTVKCVLVNLINLNFYNLTALTLSPT